MNKIDPISKSNAVPQTVLRPARADELDMVHAWQTEAIDTSPFYNDLFKQHEKRRMSRTYLQRLHEADPAHVFLVGPRDNAAGFMVSSPEFGTLWLHWSYLRPDKRRGKYAFTALREFVSFWDNGRFHKISTMTRTDNEVARLIMLRLKFTQICTLENHLFGEDYMLFEHKLHKVTEEYDHGIRPEGRLGRITRRAKGLFGSPRRA